MRCNKLTLYCVEILNWIEEALCQLDRMTRKLITMHRDNYSRADNDRLYTKTTNRGRELMNLEDCVRILWDFHIQTDQVLDRNNFYRLVFDRM